MGIQPETCGIIEEHPEIMAADVVQLLPASADRLWSKRVDVVISVFAALKRLGQSVCLVVANQWYNPRGARDSLKSYQNLAQDEGLEWGVEVVFTSELGEEYQAGISRRMIRELFLCSNLFAFPTHHESFGLVVPEACLSGVLPVLNLSLPQQVELVSGQALWAGFGGWKLRRDEDFTEADLAEKIVKQMSRDKALRSKTVCRQRYNWDAIYEKYYRPLIEAAEQRRAA